MNAQDAKDYRWKAVQELSRKVGPIAAQVVLAMIGQYPAHALDKNGLLQPDQAEIRKALPFSVPKNDYRGLLKVLHAGGWLKREVVLGRGRCYRIDFEGIDRLVVAAHGQ
jgi:hypothetical protein